MKTSTPSAVSIDSALRSLTFLADRSPATQRDDYYATLAPYRDGAIFVASYAGTTQWERHCSGDEIVLVLEGQTSLILLIGDTEQGHPLGPLDFLVVPQAVWHRFDTPHGVKVLSVTPQPTDHQTTHPGTPS